MLTYIVNVVPRDIYLLVFFTNAFHCHVIRACFTFPLYFHWFNVCLCNLYRNQAFSNISGFKLLRFIVSQRLFTAGARIRFDKCPCLSVWLSVCLVHCFLFTVVQGVACPFVYHLGVCSSCVPQCFFGGWGRPPGI